MEHGGGELVSGEATHSRTRSDKHSHAHIPPSRLRDSLLLAERVKRGAGRSIMELAWRVWAWVRPLYRNLEPRTRKRRDEGGSTDGTLRDKKSRLYWTLSEYQSNQSALYYVLRGQIFYIYSISTLQHNIQSLKINNRVH